MGEKLSCGHYKVQFYRMDRYVIDALKVFVEWVREIMFLKESHASGKYSFYMKKR